MRTRLLKLILRLFVLLHVTVIAGGCGECINGSGQIVEESRDVGPFSSVEVDGTATIHILQGPYAPVRIVTDNNIIEKLETRVVGNELRIGPKESCCFNTSNMDIYLTAPEFRSLELDGAGTFLVPDGMAGQTLTFEVDGAGVIRTGAITADEVRIYMDGSSEIQMETRVGLLKTNVDGTGDLQLRGQAVVHEVNIEGSAHVAASDLETERTYITVEGSAECTVWATDELHVNIEGAADVAYSGEPELHRQVTGLGTVEPVD